MALPWLFRKLFQNDGAGEKLKPEIVPTTVNGVAADASGNIAIKDTNIPNGPFLPLAGGVMSGSIIFGHNTSPRVDMKHPSEGYSGGLQFSWGETPKGYCAVLFSDNTEDSLKYFFLGPEWNSPLSFRVNVVEKKLWFNNHDLIYVTETGTTASGWYRKYNDGWIEQGGNIHYSGSESNHTTFMTFSIPFTTTSYFAAQTKGRPDTSTGYLSQQVEAANFQIWNKTTTSCCTRLWGPTSAITSMSYLSWYACGF